MENPDNWILLDSNSLCYISYYSIKDQSEKAIKTKLFSTFIGLTLSVLRDLPQGYPVFCWDHGPSKRKLIYPAYKEKREQKTKKEMKLRTALKKEVEKIKLKYIAKANFANNFYADGYEADDIIASLVNTLPKKDNIFIVTSDQDMFQLLASNVKIYCARTRKYTTFNDFKTKYKIHPNSWSILKAVAGCVSDCIPGCRGIGEKKILSYLSDPFPELLPFAHKIESFMVTHDYKKFYQLTNLPLEGTPHIIPFKTHIKPMKWEQIAARLDLKGK